MCACYGRFEHCLEQASQFFRDLFKTKSDSNNRNYRSLQKNANRKEKYEIKDGGFIDGCLDITQTNNTESENKSKHASLIKAKDGSKRASNTTVAFDLHTFGKGQAELENFIAEYLKMYYDGKESEVSIPCDEESIWDYTISDSELEKLAQRTFCYSYDRYADITERNEVQI